MDSIEDFLSMFLELFSGDAQIAETGQVADQHLNPYVLSIHILGSYLRDHVVSHRVSPSQKRVTMHQFHQHPNIIPLFKNTPHDLVDVCVEEWFVLILVEGQRLQDHQLPFERGAVSLVGEELGSLMIECELGGVVAESSSDQELVEYTVLLDVLAVVFVMVVEEGKG